MGWAASSICYPLVYRWFCHPPGARIQGHTERTPNPPAHGHLHYGCHSLAHLGPCRPWLLSLDKERQRGRRGSHWNGTLDTYNYNAQALTFFNETYWRTELQILTCWCKSPYQTEQWRCSVSSGFLQVAATHWAQPKTSHSQADRPKPSTCRGWPPYRRTRTEDCRWRRKNHQCPHFIQIYYFRY